MLLPFAAPFTRPYLSFSSFLSLCAVFTLFASPVLAKKPDVETQLTILVGQARVIDGDTLEVNGEKIRLQGIDAPENAQKCKIASAGRQTQKLWRCGKTAKNRLIAMTQGQDVSCRLNERDDFGRWIGTCFVSDVNLNKQMVQQGMAWAFRKYSIVFIAEEKIARQKGLGIWSADNQPAWEYRAKKWTVAEQSSGPNGCVIKGNISRRKRELHKIYHLPWFHSYKRTGINERKGERWFCSEKEAIAAGWRRAYTH